MIHPGLIKPIAFGITVVIVAASGILTSRFGLAHGTGIEGWGLGGRKFGTLITWFLVGGDFYTAYTLLAVPAAVYATGAMGFFALPYTILVYPFVFITMPRLWKVCRDNNLLTTSDFVRFRFGSRPLSGIIALTGVCSLIPYISLQLLGIETAIHHLDLPVSEATSHLVSRILSISIVAGVTYVAGLRAPASVAFAKDILIYIVVIAAILALPSHVGGYTAMFHEATTHFTRIGSGSVILRPQDFSAYASLAAGSALAAFLYPHTVTSILSSGGETAIRRNAVLLPAYTVLLGMLALLGIAGAAMNLHLASSNDVVPVLFDRMFPAPIVGFALAAIAVAAVVPASIMVISAANLIARNLYVEYLNPAATSRQQLAVAQRSTLAVCVVALLFTVAVPKQLAVNLQLMAGMIVLQTFPSVILGLWKTRLHSGNVIAGWLTGTAAAIALCSRSHFASPLVSIGFGSAHFNLYIGVVALLLNLLVAHTARIFTAR